VSTPPPPDQHCPSCGAPHSPNQEYCLECGHRLTPPGGILGGLANMWRSRFGRYPGDWVWPVLLGFVIAVAGAGAAILLADAGAEDTTIVATEGGGAHVPTTPPVTTVELPSVPTGTPTGPPSTPTQPPPATTTAPAPGSLTSWPASVSGYTVVLVSIPTSAGRALALERARAASRGGLPKVGVLDSSKYSSLHPGYYVVFSGIYTSSAQADRARQSAAEQGFPLSYSREITR
jgi:zinc-ribbon domain